MCFETEFESYKALLTVVVSFELILPFGASMRHYYFHVLSLGLGSTIRCLVLRGGFSNTTVFVMAPRINEHTCLLLVLAPIEVAIREKFIPALIGIHPLNSLLSYDTGFP